MNQVPPMLHRQDKEDGAYLHYWVDEKNHQVVMLGLKKVMKYLKIF